MSSVAVQTPRAQYRHSEDLFIELASMNFCISWVIVMMSLWNAGHHRCGCVMCNLG